MSLREREVLIEYIRTVRDNQVLLERLAQYIDTANNRLTTVVLAYINGVVANIHTASTSPTTTRETTSETTSIASRNTSSQSIPSLLSARRPTSIPLPPPPPAAPPPAPPEPPAPPTPPLSPMPPPVRSIASGSRGPIYSRLSSAATSSPRRRRRRTTSTYLSSESDYLTPSSNTPENSNVGRIRSWINSVPDRTIENTTSTAPLDIPPGLNRSNPSERERLRNFVVSSRYTIPQQRTPPPPPTTLPSLISVPNLVNDGLVYNLDSPVRIRPNISQIRSGTELLKWEDISGNYQEMCPIDFNPFIEGDDILRIKSCQHIFREMNLRCWFRQSPRCPICRYDIRDYILETE